jgi:hypothetical protein
VDQYGSKEKSGWQKKDRCQEEEGRRPQEEDHHCSQEEQSEEGKIAAV